jgi:hypothetical protein
MQAFLEHFSSKPCRFYIEFSNIKMLYRVFLGTTAVRHTPYITVLYRDFLIFVQFPGPT